MRVEWSYLTVRECQQMQLQVWLSAQVKVTGPHTLLLYSDVFHLPNQNSRQKVQGGTGGTQHARGTAWHWSCRCLGAWLVTPRSHTLPQGSVSFHPHSVLVMMCFIVTTPLLTDEFLCSLPVCRCGALIFTWIQPKPPHRVDQNPKWIKSWPQSPDRPCFGCNTVISTHLSWSPLFII